MVEGRDDDLWLPYRGLFRPGMTRRDLRELDRERRIHSHVERRREQGARTRPKDRSLTRGDIVAAAMRVADAEGVDAVSMRRVARELRAGAMSLYWHVESKEDLQDLMLEQVEAEVQAPEPSGDWRADLRVFAHNVRTAKLRHPWAMDFVRLRPPSGPNDARNADRLFAIFDGLGLDIATTIRLATTFGIYVNGAVQNEIQEIRGEREMTQATSEMTAGELEALRAEFGRLVRESAQYPHIVKLMDAGIDPDDPATRGERFDFGLGVMLDGIAAQLKRD
jgi:AcrR family transcriptional regulator